MSDEGNNQNGASTEAQPENSNDLQQQIETLKKERDEAKTKLLYMAADLDNYRKQAIKERSDLLKFGSEPLVREMLTVLDNLERASQIDLKPGASEEMINAYKSGVDMIVEQFRGGLKKFGVEAVESTGVPFNPQEHEALSSEQNPDFPPNVVSRVFKKAYKLHGKLIRPAQVVVNTGKPDAQ